MTQNAYLTAERIAREYGPRSPQVRKLMAREILIAIATARIEEREQCAKIADDRAVEDDAAYKNETDWRMPYAFNRVVRASMDIAHAIRGIGASGAQSNDDGM